MTIEIPKNLIIPMCGIGKRFIDAGFIDHKSMLIIDGENMLERIIKKFDNVNVYLILTKNILKKLKSNLNWEIINKKINCIFIDDHKLGPAYSIFKCFNSLPKGVGTYISYCDITWEWDEKSFLGADTKAAIFCHYGFHPHLVNNNFSAFCKYKKNNPNKLEMIKEKASFTKDWMQEPLSIGLFYINDLENLRSPLNEMIKNKNKVANEFFPSILFNYVLKNGFEVDLIPVKSFVHYGTPLQFKDINSWSKYFKKSNEIIPFNKKINNFEACIMISGSGSRMKVINHEEKYLLKAGKFSLIEHVINSLPINKEKISLICNDKKKDIKFLPSCVEYYQIKRTNSQFESLFLSTNHIKKKNNFFLCSCDCFGFFNLNYFKEIVDSKLSEVIIFGFTPSLLQLQLKSSFSSFTYDKNKVKNFHIKEVPEENYLGLAGFFWFRNGKILAEAIEKFAGEKQTLKREIIIDDILNYMREKKANISYIYLDKYIHLGTPEEYNEYKYWHSKIVSLID